MSTLATLEKPPESTMPLRRATQPVYRFHVFYRPNPLYDGDYQICQAEGLQGVFRTPGEARVAADRCKSWFNVERILVTKPEVRGVVTTEVKEIDHKDTVEVWI